MSHDLEPEDRVRLRERQAVLESHIIAQLDKLTFDEASETFLDSPVPTVISKKPPADGVLGYFELFSPTGHRYYVGHDDAITNRRDERIGRTTAYDVWHFKLPLFGTFKVYQQHYSVVDGLLGPADWTSSYTTWRGRIVGAAVTSIPRRSMQGYAASSDLEPWANGMSHAADVLVQFAETVFHVDISPSPTDESAA